MIKMTLTFKEKYGYGIGAFGKDLVYAVMATFLMFYFTDVLGISAGFIGILFFVARLWDAINDPIMGLIVDNTGTRWGKFRPWILTGTILNAIVLVFLYTKPVFTGNALYVYVSVFYILWGMTYTMMDIPYWSLIPAISHDEATRNQISVIPRIFAALGYFVVSSFGLVFVNRVIGGEQSRGFFLLALIIAIVFVITCSITVLSIKEKPIPKQKAKFKFSDIFKTIAKNDQLLAVISVVTLYTIAINLTAGFGIYYFKYDLDDENLFSLFAMIAGVAQVLAMIGFPTLAKVISRRTIFITAALLSFVGYLSLFLVGLHLQSNIIIMLGIAGLVLFLGFGFLQVLSTIMLADSVDYGQYKLGYRTDSIIFSMQPFIVKFSTAVSGLITGVGLWLIGFKANIEQSPDTIVGMRIIMFAVPVFLVLISLLIYLKFYRLNGPYYTKVMEAIASQRSETFDNV